MYGLFKPRSNNSSSCSAVKTNIQVNVNIQEQTVKTRTATTPYELVLKGYPVLDGLWPTTSHRLIKYVYARRTHTDRHIKRMSEFYRILWLETSVLTNVSSMADVADEEDATMRRRNATMRTKNAEKVISK